jgi:cold shock CspA family protein
MKEQGKVVKKFATGYGFVSHAGYGDVFFHASACVTPFDEIYVGDLVEYEMTVDDQQRPRATQVTVVA